MFWLIVSLIVVSLLFLFSLFYVVKFGLIVLNVQDVIEESLDVLDERYANISEVVNTPLFYDSPEIRKVLKDIDTSRDSILKIATALTNIEDIQNPPSVGDEEEEA